MNGGITVDNNMLLRQCLMNNMLIAKIMQIDIQYKLMSDPACDWRPANKLEISTAIEKESVCLI
jgi:hypothetical protein